MEDFERWLRQGRGRAVLFLREQTDAAPYRDRILHACTHNLAYDRQIEPYRGPYLFDILEATGEPDWYAPRVRHALAHPGEDVCIGQLYELCGEFARRGDEAARRTMYAAFARDAPNGDTDGGEALIDLDGRDGFLRVAEQLIRHPLPEDDRWLEDNFVDRLEERIGKEEAWTTLESATETLPDLAELLERVRLRREENARYREGLKNKEPVPTYDEVRRRILEPGQNSLGRIGWTLDANDALMRRLAEDLAAEADPERQAKYLDLFRRHAFPLDPEPLIRLARSPNWRVERRAMSALENVTHAAVRAFALELFDGDDLSGDGARLLARNFEPGDYERVRAALARGLSEDDVHHMGLGVLDMMDENPSPEAATVLRELFEREPCVPCRENCVRRLAELGPLPDRMAEECRWDASQELRKRFRPAEE